MLDQKNQGTRVGYEIQTRNGELNSINQDQARIRENMKALKGSAEEKVLLARYTKQLDSQEDRMAKLNSEIADLRNKQAMERQKLEDIVQQVTQDESF